MAYPTVTNRPVVLIVEDEALIRAGALDWVEEAGFEAIEAANADEAIRILESRNDIRILFTDIDMPGSMDGLKLAHAVRNRWPAIKLVVTSGRSLPANKDLPKGGRFIGKPYAPSQVATFRELIAETWTPEADQHHETRRPRLENGRTRNDTGSAYSTWELRPGASLSRSARIDRLDRLSRLLDTAILIPGIHIRFGADAVIGLMPVLGDTITAALAAWIVYEAHRLGTPRHLILRMIGNVAADGLIGAVPLAGDVFDLLFRANRRNMRLLLEHLQREGWSR
jgi:CheY-like chemotaxis protein